MASANARPLPTFARHDDQGAADGGFVVLDAEATYFLCVDLDASGIAIDESVSPEAAASAGIAVVPISAFAEIDPPRHLVRLCFGKKDETIEAGVAAMAKARELLGMSTAKDAARSARGFRCPIQRNLGQLFADRRQPRSGAWRWATRSRRRPRGRGIPRWRTVAAPRRGELVRLLGEELRRAKPELARMVTLEAARSWPRVSAKCRR